MSDVLAFWRDHANDPKAQGGFAHMPTEDLRVIMDTLATLTAENARLREDAARLEHMAKNCYALSCITDNDGIPRYRASVVFPWVTDFRAALDTARAQGWT